MKLVRTSRKMINNNGNSPFHCVALDVTGNDYSVFLCFLKILTRSRGLIFINFFPPTPEREKCVLFLLFWNVTFDKFPNVKWMFLVSTSMYDLKYINISNLKIDGSLIRNHAPLKVLNLILSDHKSSWFLIVSRRHLVGV